MFIEEEVMCDLQIIAEGTKKSNFSYFLNSTIAIILIRYLLTFKLFKNFAQISNPHSSLKIDFWFVRRMGRDEVAFKTIESQ